MEIISYINQHFPIWSMLDGDHALKNSTNLINPNLVSNPDFLSPIENNLRYEIFKSKRNWIAEKMGVRASFALVKFSYKDLRDFQTCFSDISLRDFVYEYKNSHYSNKQFKINNLHKSYNDVDDLMWFMKKIKHEFFEVQENEVLNFKCRNDNISFALNRSILMKDQGKYYILDGTHRLSAYYLVAQKSNNIPNDLYGFLFEKNYKH